MTNPIVRIESALIGLETVIKAFSLTMNSTEHEAAYCVLCAIEHQVEAVRETLDREASEYVDNA